jgi:hypothetical protein
MAGLIDRNRIPVSLVPERMVADAANEQGVVLSRLRPRAEGTPIVVDEALREVIDAAARKWVIGISLWRRIPFTMQHQQQSQWCWAATSVSVALYYQSWSGWTQCEMVNQERGQTTCCDDGSTDLCNQPNVLDSPLDRAGVLDHMVGGSIAYDEVAAEIDAGRPVAWRIQWAGGGGHFAVIEGYRWLGGQWFAIDDPWYGQSDVPLTTLTGGTYQGSGSWSHTYFTRRQPIWIRIPELEHRFLVPEDIWSRILEHEVVLTGGGARP